MARFLGDYLRDPAPIPPPIPEVWIPPTLSAARPYRLARLAAITATVGWALLCIATVRQGADAIAAAAEFLIGGSA